VEIIGRALFVTAICSAISVNQFGDDRMTPALHLITYSWDSGDTRELAQGSCVADLTDDQAEEMRAMLGRRLDDEGNGEEYSVEKVTIKAAEEALVFVKEELSIEETQCSGDGCKEVVKPEGDYYATPCGTFCDGCMKEHAKHCEICRNEFDIEIEDEDLTAPELQAKYDDLSDGEWGIHPDFSMDDWRHEASAGNTRLGYWDWVKSQISLS
jgi:hypothetical protein